MKVLGRVHYTDPSHDIIAKMSQNQRRFLVASVWIIGVVFTTVYLAPYVAPCPARNNAGFSDSASTFFRTRFHGSQGDIAGELLVGVDFKILNQDEIVENIARKTGGVIIGQDRATRVYQLCYSGLARRQNGLNDIRENVRSTPGIVAASENFVTQ